MKMLLLFQNMYTFRCYTNYTRHTNAMSAQGTHQTKGNSCFSRGCVCVWVRVGESVKCSMFIYILDSHSYLKNWNLIEIHLSEKKNMYHLLMLICSYTCCVCAKKILSRNIGLCIVLRCYTSKHTRQTSSL